MCCNFRTVALIKQKLTHLGVKNGAARLQNSTFVPSPILLIILHRTLMIRRCFPFTSFRAHTTKANVTKKKKWVSTLYNLSARTISIASGNRHLSLFPRWEYR